MSFLQSKKVNVVWIIRGASAVVIALAFTGVLGLAGMSVNQELRVIAPSRLARGERFPVRALLFDGLSAIQGPRLADGEVDAEVVDAAGKQIAHVRLRSGLGKTHEGTMSVPATAPAHMQLRVHAATEQGAELNVAMPVQAMDSSKLVRMPEPRLLRGLQQLSFGNVVAVGGGEASGAGAPPAVMSLDVAGGACVPELPCELFVYGLPPLTRIGVVGHASAEEVQTRSSSGPLPMTIARVIPHGPEALVELQASASAPSTSAGESPRDVQREQRWLQRVRLPMALGGQTLAVSTRLVDREVLQLELLGNDTSPCIVDAFVLGQWRNSATIAHCDQPFTLPFELPSGLVRLQVRRDPFASENAAVAVVFRTGPPSTDALASLVRTAKTSAVPGTPFSRLLAEVDAHRADWSEEERNRAAVQIVVAQEMGVLSMPDSVGSLAEMQAGLSAQKRRLRALAVSSILIACFALLLSVGRSGVAAALQAEEVMRLSGQDLHARRRGQKQRQLRIFVALLSLLLGFLAMAAYVLVRF